MLPSGYYVAPSQTLSGFQALFNGFVGQNADYAFDGDPATCTFIYGQQLKSWILIDLGRTFMVGGARLTFHTKYRRSECAQLFWRQEAGYQCAHVYMYPVPTGVRSYAVLPEGSVHETMQPVASNSHIGCEHVTC